MRERQLTIDTADGAMRAFLTEPDDDPNAPAVAVDEQRLVAGDQEEFGRLVATMNQLTDKMAVADLRVTLDALGAPGAAGLIGFCTGGRFAIRAMAAPGDRLAGVAWAGTLHLFASRLR